MKVSEWQDGFPPCDGIWEILVPEHIDLTHTEAIYFARYKDGKWNAGSSLEDQKENPYFESYILNNNPKNPRQWRGVIEE